MTDNDALHAIYILCFDLLLDLYYSIDTVQKGCMHVIKRHQIALSKKVADHFQCFFIELNRGDTVFLD